MKTRKKTKLCLQCNGVNPLSATHCAYCGAVLAAEEFSQEEALEAPSQAVMSDLFAVPKEAPSPQAYSPSRLSQPFVQAREPQLSEESVSKPLYSVFDQPQSHQIGNLRDELMEKPQRIHPTIALEQPPSAAQGTPHKESKGKGYLSKLQQGLQIQLQGGSFLEVLASTAFVSGTLLAALALLTLLFEDSGKVVLSWSSERAPWLFIGSLAMLLMGWKAFGRTGEPS